MCVAFSVFGSYGRVGRAPSPAAVVFVFPSLAQVRFYMELVVSALGSVRNWIAFLITPQERDQSNASDGQRSQMMPPSRSHWKNDRLNENQNVHQACGNSPKTRAALPPQRAKTGLAGDPGCRHKQRPCSEMSVALSVCRCGADTPVRYF
jgi:hypothetical protein